MNNRFRLIQLGVFLAGCFAVFLAGDANSQERPPYAVTGSLRFEKIEGSIPGQPFHYARGSYKTYYDGKGLCAIQSVNFLAEKYGLSFSTGCTLRTGDVVAMLGGVFRAKCDDSVAVLDLIPDKDVPKGVKVPAWDSITVPLSGSSGFNLVSLKLLEVNSKAETGAIASLELMLIFTEKPRKKKNITLVATVKAGEIILIRDKGHLVRAIVPPDRKSRVVGWLELSPEPIPEANLIRDKKAFVRPMPKVDEPK